MSGFSIEETRYTYGAKIKVIGVGGGGGNMINHMINEGISGIDLIVANTDAQALDYSQATTKQKDLVPACFLMWAENQHLRVMKR